MFSDRKSAKKKIFFSWSDSLVVFTIIIIVTELKGQVNYNNFSFSLIVFKHAFIGHSSLKMKISVTNKIKIFPSKKISKTFSKKANNVNFS